MIERTLSVIKPDAVAKNLTGELIKRIEQTGLKIIGLRLIQMTKEHAKGFYKVLEKKPFYESVTDFMSSGPCVVMVLEGEDAIKRYRKLIGTNHKEAMEGTIRREFATDVEKNIVHGSDGLETAAMEIEFFLIKWN